MLRVYGDRLVDDNDIKWLVEQIRKTMKLYMDDDLDNLFQDLRTNKMVRFFSLSKIIK